MRADCRGHDCATLDIDPHTGCQTLTKAFSKIQAAMKLSTAVNDKHGKRIIDD